MRGLLICVVILIVLGCESPQPRPVYKFKQGQCVNFVVEENRSGVVDYCAGRTRPYLVRYFDGMGQLQSDWFEEYELTEKQQ